MIVSTALPMALRVSTQQIITRTWVLSTVIMLDVLIPYVISFSGFWGDSLSVTDIPNIRIYPYGVKCYFDYFCLQKKAADKFAAADFPVAFITLQFPRYLFLISSPSPFPLRTSCMLPLQAIELFNVFPTALNFVPPTQ